MTNRTHVGVVVLLLAAGQIGCDGGASVSPTAPSRQVQQAAPAPAPAPAPGWSYGGGFVLRAVALFGVITETTPAGEVPIAGVTVYCDACGAEGHTWTETAADGTYRFSGDLSAGGGIWLSANQTVIWVGKEGYQDPAGQPALPGFNGPGWRTAPIAGDTRFDVQLARQ
jgi:hypothetical protein